MRQRYDDLFIFPIEKEINVEREQVQYQNISRIKMYNPKLSLNIDYEMLEKQRQ